ncbi:cytochrome o ubiquinol oxidase subunit IV [Kushneria indalinina]|uniref:Cytochrome bo(3) ubiquinol oxidase subunit 4 n=1 Tax=Kushneria indalinina DSM 14324 TaxID=1122140 RepID=A0A3D9DXT6_9GAMM|nr:cytochrome o ubiquinol oxidase subunit IV [Kushneria indalinina]REC95600.1 cytochrome o ubiquinol oxidase operon protein cyoD [Kushneria indalinina DSM 14324]
MSTRQLNEQEARECKTEQRSYLWGFGLALVLTLIPFGLVAFADVERMTLWLTIGGCALAQVIVHLRFFMHITLAKNKREDLLLVLFTVLILVILCGGTLWILFDLYKRMLPGMMP